MTLSKLAITVLPKVISLRNARDPEHGERRNFLPLAPVWTIGIIEQYASNVYIFTLYMRRHYTSAIMPGDYKEFYVLSPAPLPNV